MAVFTWINENGATGIVIADDIIGAAEILGNHCYVNSDVVVRELSDQDYRGQDCVYFWEDESDVWPWLITRENGTDYEYKLCKRKDPYETPWGAVEYTASIIPGK